MHWLLIGYIFLFVHRPFELWPALGELHVERVYILAVMAAWLVWRQPASPARRRALGVYIGQLALNAIWTPVFFGLYPTLGVSALWIALGIIIALDIMVLLTMLAFWPVRRLAAVLLIPYWAWVLYATTLNAALAVMNP